MSGRSLESDISGLASEFGPQFSGRKVLVTGGAGFLGSWLCDVFVRAGSKVDCVDNLSTSTSQNLDHLKEKLNFIASNVEDVTLEGTYDYIFHFSSRASPDEYIHHPIETLTTNSAGTMRILELARRGGDSILVQASTSEIYGDAQVVPTPESYYGYTNSIGIRSCYDEGKRFAEALAMAYFRQFKVNVRIARIFNSYGPRIRADGLYGRALPRFIRQAIRGEPITIYGDGTQTRSFCYVRETIRGILKLASLGTEGGVVFNLGNPEEIAILDLAKKIVERTGSASTFKFLPLMQDDPRRRCPDISRAKDELRWEPGVSFDEGLSRTIEWFRSR